jgi:glucose-specific phosphotransferase system IIA component
MFGLFKRKQREIVSPVDGQVVDITEVPDEVFSRKMVGEGVAVKPVGDTFCSPIDGVVSKIFSTKHAFSIKSDKDLEIMVHIGLETVALEGKGFECLVHEGDKVAAGDPIIKADLNYIAEHAKDTVTPIIISEESDIKNVEKKLRIVKCGDVIMEVN